MPNQHLNLSRRAFLSASAASLVAQAPSRPNILLILIDDMAQRALSCYGNPHIKTPHIDSLARDGVKFTQAYVTPQCTPTRATILTGQYTARNRMWHVIPKYGYPWARVAEPDYQNNLSRDAFTLPKGLQSAGYRTGIFGKWHLTTNRDGNYTALRPEAARYYGFDTVSTPPPFPNEQNTGDKGVDRLTTEALDFMTRDARAPFFCYLSHHTVHGRVSAPEPLIANYRQRGFPERGLHNATYLAALQHMDDSVGRILAELDRRKLAANTTIFFLSDNGGVSESWDPQAVAGDPISLRARLGEFENPPLRAGKGSPYEGGARVPLLVRWPGVIRANRISTTPVHAVDLLPTLFDMAGATAPPDYIRDGVSLLPHFRGRALDSRPLYSYTPFYDIRWAQTPCASIRVGDYKLIEYFGDFIDTSQGATYRLGPRLELYNLSRDLSESRNLASTEPKRVDGLRAQLHRWILSCGATIPGLNPNYDPSRALTETKSGAD